MLDKLGGLSHEEIIDILEFTGREISPERAIKNLAEVFDISEDDVLQQIPKLKNFKGFVRFSNRRFGNDIDETYGYGNQSLEIAFDIQGVDEDGLVFMGIICEDSKKGFIFQKEDIIEYLEFLIPEDLDQIVNELFTNSFH